MAAWLEAGEANWSPVTAYRYRCLVKGKVLPALGDIRLDRLSARHLDTLYADLRKQGLSNRSVLRVHATLRTALNRALKWHWVPSNVATLASTGPQGGATGRVATDEEVKALLAAADPDLGFAIRLACATGMRRSELAGLQWSDVDFTTATATVTVSRAVVMVGRAVEKGTKTHAVRSIPLAPQTLELLRGRRGIGSVLGATPDQLSARLSELRDAVGIEGDGFGWHAFRHYAGTSLAGVADLRTVADILGHSTLRTTERYVHARAERSRAAVMALDGSLD
jgi:integrase